MAGPPSPYISGASGDRHTDVGAEIAYIDLSPANMTNDTRTHSSANETAPRTSVWRHQMAFIGASVLCFGTVVGSMWDCPSVGTLLWLVLDLFQNQFPKEYLHRQHETDVIAIEIISTCFYGCIS